MPYPRVKQPIPGPEAFGSFSDEAVLSQAAQLLFFRHTLRGDDLALQARARLPTAVPEEDWTALGVSPLRHEGVRFSAKQASHHLLKAHGLKVPRRVPKEENWERVSRALPDLADSLQKQPGPLGAVALMEACLLHAHELVRVAAAAGYMELATDPRRLILTLAGGTESKEPLVRAVAATTLARVAPNHPSLRRLIRRTTRGGGKEPARTSLIIHGTWAQDSDWYKPGGDFHSYLKNEVPLPDLYSANDFFSWSGSYTDEGRADGAQKLVAWVRQHKNDGAAGDPINLYTHSHGGSVAMLATQAGLDVGKLVLLSCPVHIPKYEPDYSRVQRLFSVRVHFDLVILADGGGQKFRDPPFHENVLGLWFDHFATHDPNVWREFDIPTKIQG